MPSIQSLVDEHYQALYRYAYRLSGSAADAEDLTQETFRKALHRLATLRDADRVKPWLFRILRNAYLHRIRDDRRRRVVPLDGEVARPEAESADWPVDPERLQEALDNLDESFRTPLILYYFDDFSYKDIADQMDVPIGTVMSRLARGKAYLKDALTPRTMP